MQFECLLAGFLIVTCFSKVSIIHSNVSGLSVSRPTDCSAFCFYVFSRHCLECPCFRSVMVVMHDVNSHSIGVFSIPIPL